MPLQDISDIVGHKSTHVTETVYQHVIVPAIRGGASVMDSVFGDGEENENGAADLAATPFTWLIGGAMGIRTPDLFHAMDARPV
jgi:hypothetical protein